MSEAPIPRQDQFQEFTYARRRHFEAFAGLDVALYGQHVDPEEANLKFYQDLLVLAFIRNNVPPGSRLLEMGGGESRIIGHLKQDYECWNVDRLEGRHGGPACVRTDGFRLVRAYVGEHSPELPDGYFDFAYSISVVEHLPADDPTVWANVLDDLNRALRPGGSSLHCVDVFIKGQSIWVHPALKFMFERQRTVNELGSLAAMASDPDLWAMSESAYRRLWQPLLGRSYQDAGRPSSVNILWNKP